MPKREDAVSGAVGSVLLIALVIIGAAYVGMYVMSQPLPEKIPKVQFNVKVVDGDLVLEHVGGERLDRGAYGVIVDGTPTYPNRDWAMGGPPIVLPGLGNARSVRVVYIEGSGDTLLRSINSPWGFYVFPGFDPDETIDVPKPQSVTNYTFWNGIRPANWPLETGIDPSPDTVTAYDPSKVAYVAACDTKIFPPDSGIVPTGLAVPPEARLFVCDGTDDDREINDALSMVQGDDITHGGTVVLLGGTFTCSDRIRVPSYTRLVGQGSAKTKVRMFAEAGQSGYLPVTLDQPYVTVEGFSLYGNGFVMVTTSHVRVRNINATSLESDIPGAAMRPASGNGMFFVWATMNDLQDIEFYRCVARDCNTHGFNMNQQWDFKLDDSQARTIGWVRFVFCEAIQCGFGEPAGSRSEWITGFDLHEWQDLRHLFVINCTAYNNWESGFHLEPGGRYDDAGTIVANRTISEDIHFSNCTSADNGWRNTYSGAFFMSGFYLSRDTYLKDCVSVHNRNAGYYVHGGENCDFDHCWDTSSTYGWKVCKASSDIRITNCKSWNNPRWALWLSFSQGITVEHFEQHNVGGDRGYQNILGWYKDESAYQQPVTDSKFQITAYDNAMPIINHAGSGNTYDLSYG